MVTPRVLFSLGLLSFNVPNWWVAVSFYAPCVAALWLQWVSERNLRVCRFYQSWRRLLLGLGVGAFFVLVCNPVVAAFFGASSPLHALNWRVFFSFASYHLYFSEFFAPIGQEIGWRGYALERLEGQLGPVWASVLIGLMWAGFMLPALSLVQIWPISGVLMYTIALVALSVEMTFAMNLSGLSIIVAIVMHALASTQSGILSHGLIAAARLRPHWEWLASVSNLLVPALLVLATWGGLGASIGRTRPDSHPTSPSLSIAVGTPVARCPPHGPGRALLSASGSYLG
jgi:membrane protease YdiL (CAAX protease family)